MSTYSVLQLYFERISADPAPMNTDDTVVTEPTNSRQTIPHSCCNMKTTLVRKQSFLHPTQHTAVILETVFRCNQLHQYNKTKTNEKTYNQKYNLQSTHKLLSYNMKPYLMKLKQVVLCAFYTFKPENNVWLSHCVQLHCKNYTAKKQLKITCASKQKINNSE